MLVILVKGQEKKNKNAKYNMEVRGNCDMCKNRIEKAALSVKGVKVATWYTNQQDLHLILDENKCSVEQVSEAIADVGHDTEKMKATDKAYANLHGCCKFERKQ